MLFDERTREWGLDYEPQRCARICSDGRTRNIPDLYDGAIEITPIPTVEELNAHVWGEEFHACVIEQVDREDRYSMIFFVDENMALIKSVIQINGWVIQLNDFEL